MKIKSWPCVFKCRNPVTEIGAYVKLSAGKYGHLNCYAEVVSKAACEDLLQEQAQAKRELEAREQREREEQAARERALAERRLEIQERERVNRIEAQKALPLPPRVSAAEREEAARRAIAEGRSVVLGDKVPERKPDRFELLDLDEVVDENIDEPPSGGPEEP